MHFSCYASPTSNFNVWRIKHKPIQAQQFQLYKAVLNNDLLTIAAYISANISLDYKIPTNWRYKINRGYDLAPAPAWDDLPLIHLAAMIARYDIAILNALLIKGANHKVKHELSHNKYSGSILHNMQQMHLNDTAFKLLIKHGADVNAVNSLGHSVVTGLLNSTHIFYDSYSCSGVIGNRLYLLKIYLDNGAVLTPDNILDILNLIATDGISDIAIQIIEKCLSQKADFTLNSGGSLLHFLAGSFPRTTRINQQKFSALVDNVIAQTNNLNTQDKNGRTAFSIAAECSPMVLSLLLSKKDDNGALKVDINLADNRGVTPLMHAIKSEINVATLLNAGASVDICNHDGSTACHYAAVQNTLAEILQHTTNCDQPDQLGRTPLMLAIMAGKLENAALLLARGANIWAKTKDGKTIIDFALNSQMSLTFVQAEMIRQEHELGLSKNKLALT